jgi:transcription antitermination factor NusA-like protein
MNLPIRAVTVPPPLRNNKWDLIVATQHNNWVKMNPQTKFYWDENNDEIKIVSISNDDSMARLDHAEEYLQGIFADENQCKMLNDSALALFDTSSTTKRHFDGEQGRPDAPDNPAVINAEISGSHDIANPFENQNNQNMDPIKIDVLEPRPDGSYQKYITIRNDRVGLLIGAAGKTLKLVKKLADCNIAIPQIEKDPRLAALAPDRAVLLQGSLANIAKAEEEIKWVLNLSQNTVEIEIFGPAGTTEKLEIPSDTVGAVIGKSGDTIRLIQMKTHAHVAMEKDADVAANATVRVVTLTGTTESIAAAKKSIQELLTSFKSSRNSDGQRFDPEVILFGHSSQPTKTIKIDNHIVGVVIGAHGANFKTIKNETRCHVQVDKELKNPVRLVTITGPSQHAVDRAVTMVTDFVTRAQNQVGQRQGNYNNQNNNQNNQQGGRYNNNNNNNNNRSLNQQPQQVNGYGHRQQQLPQNPMDQNNMFQMMGMGMPGMNPMNNLGGMNPMGGMMGNPMGGMMGNPMAMFSMMNQPQQQPHGAPPVAPPANVPAAKPQPARPLPPDKLAEFHRYYDHYITQHPPDKALYYAQYYIDNPPTSPS